MSLFKEQVTLFQILIGLSYQKEKYDNDISAKKCPACGSILKKIENQVAYKCLNSKTVDHRLSNLLFILYQKSHEYPRYW